MMIHGSASLCRNPLRGFVAKAVRDWLSRLEVGTLFIEPGSPWENGYVESFNEKLRDELLNGEIFTTPQEAPQATKEIAEVKYPNR